MSNSKALTIAITGPTSGIGKATTKALYQKGHNIILIGRNQEKLKSLKAELNAKGKGEVSFYLGDLADLKSIRRCAKEILNKELQIDVLINNAGGIIPNLRYSADNFEYSFAMNHLGHFYLTKLLKPCLAKSSEPRIINVSSTAHKMGKLDFKDLAHRKKNYSAFKAYADAKLCNIYFSKELAKRWTDINAMSFSLHPGVVDTGFASDYQGFMGFLVKLGKFFMISPSKGAETSIYLASTSDIDHLENGAYFTKKKSTPPSNTALDSTAAKKLWEYSEELLTKNGFQVEA